MKNINISIVQLEQILTSAKEIPSNIWMFGLNCVSLQVEKSTNYQVRITKLVFPVEGI